MILISSWLEIKRMTEYDQTNPQLVVFVICLLICQFTSVAFRSVSIHPRCKSSLDMALTPIGPFCPFRSDASEDLNPKFEDVQNVNPDFATEMARFQLDMQMGQTPDPERLRIVADGIDQAVKQWEDLVTRLRISPDFQTREYAKVSLDR